MTAEMLDRHADLLTSAGITILEFDSPAIEFEVASPVGTVAIMAHLYRVEDRLVFDQLHVSGEGLTIALIRRLAKIFGQVEDVVEVMIQGGERSSGANRGSTPSLVRVRVK